MMAKLLKTYIPGPELKRDKNGKLDLKAYHAAEKKLTDQYDVLRFPVADGYACYAVKSVSPPVLQFMDLGDGYEADPALIRGLRAVDIRQRLQQAQAMRKLFEKSA